MLKFLPILLLTVAIAGLAAEAKRMGEDPRVLADIQANEEEVQRILANRRKLQQHDERDTTSDTEYKRAESTATFQKRQTTEDIAYKAVPPSRRDVPRAG